MLYIIVSGKLDGIKIKQQNEEPAAWKSHQKVQVDFSPSLHPPIFNFESQIW